MLHHSRKLRLSLRLFTVPLFLLHFFAPQVCAADDDLGRGGEVPHRVMKFAAPQKTSTVRQNSFDPSPLPRKSQWQVTQSTGKKVRAFMKGSWGQMASGGLTDCDFQPVTPPDLLAGLGLATFYKADTAGWFLATGKRILVKTTEAQRGYPTYSYESLARMGWGVGVTKGTIPTARAYWDAADEAGKTLDEFIASAVNEAPLANAWIVAAHVHFETVNGQALSRSPSEFPPMNDSSDRNDPSRSFTLPQKDASVSGLLVALVVRARYGDSKVARELEKRFFPSGEKASANGLLTRAHYAILIPGTALGPLPVIKPAFPYQQIWDCSYKDPLFPHVSTVRKALNGTIITEANLSVWAIDSLGPYDLYKPGTLVDVQAMDPSIEGEQIWATSDTFVGEPVYDKPRLLLRKEVAEKVLRINARLKEQGFKLKIFDAYRPFSVTQRLYRLKPEEAKKGYLASPNMGSRHNRGAALDLTIVNMAGDELLMPSPYLCFDERAHRTWVGMTPEMQFNIQYLTNAMATEGFTAINEEWWHYDAPGWERYPVLDRPLWPVPGEQPVTFSEPVIRDLASPGLAMSALATSESIPINSTVSTSTSSPIVPLERVETPTSAPEPTVDIEEEAATSNVVMTGMSESAPKSVAPEGVLPDDTSGLFSLASVDVDGLPRYLLTGMFFLLSFAFAWIALRQLRA